MFPSPSHRRDCHDLIQGLSIQIQGILVSLQKIIIFLFMYLQMDRDLLLFLSFLYLLFLLNPSLYAEIIIDAWEWRIRTKGPKSTPGPIELGRSSFQAVCYSEGGRGPWRLTLPPSCGLEVAAKRDGERRAQISPSLTCPRPAVATSGLPRPMGAHGAEVKEQGRKGEVKSSLTPPHRAAKQKD